MVEALLPLFPLQVVLFPRTLLPLHIFEERYKEMMREVQERRGEFGVVLAREKGIVNIGCTATIERVMKEYPDGRLDILTVGRRRFEVVMLDEERTFLRGSVQLFDDEDERPAPVEVQQKVLDCFHRLAELEETQTIGEPVLGMKQMSFQVAQLIPDLDYRQMLLGLRSERERMEQLAGFLPSFLARQAATEHIKRVAPRNGHGKHMAG